ncbi:MAG TPA: hypothetical protein VLZ77_10565 [Acidimicrobiales bacterium]|nr:hypothetical protein [Acidimicrobiales bacterium]
MAVVTHTVLSGVTPEQYDAVRAEVGWLEDAPAAGLVLMTWWEGGDCHNLDAGESEAASGAFGEGLLGPAMAKVGVTAEPAVTSFPAHEVYAPRALTVTTG